MEHLIPKCKFIVIPCNDLKWKICFLCSLNGQTSHRSTDIMKLKLGTEFSWRFFYHHQQDCRRRRSKFSGSEYGNILHNRGYWRNRSEPNSETSKLKNTSLKKSAGHWNDLVDHAQGQYQTTFNYLQFLFPVFFPAAPRVHVFQNFDILNTVHFQSLWPWYLENWLFFHLASMEFRSASPKTLYVLNSANLPGTKIRMACT